MYQRIDVLDQGFVALVGVLGSDRSIVDAARVSYDNDKTGAAAAVGQKDEKLIAYLMQHRHTTPFESVVFNFEAKAPIAVRSGIALAYPSACSCCGRGISCKSQR